MKKSKLTLVDAYTMAVGGMIGGGIFSVLGLVVDISGHLAATAFFIAGALTFLTGLAFARLYDRWRIGGGVIAYIRAAGGSSHLAGHMGWALIAGYIFTTSLYAYTFGHYLANVFGSPVWFASASAAAVITVILGINLRGIGETAEAEQISVWFKLAALGLLAGIGLWQFNGQHLAPLANKGTVSPLIAAAVIFVAFEGFELLTYDVDEMERPERNLRRAMLYAIVTSTAVYALVTIGSQMLVTDAELVGKREVALAIAGTKVLGTVGLWIATVAALFSTASAINATLFSTARLAEELAEEGQLPKLVLNRNRRGTPAFGLIMLSTASVAFAMLGSIERIVTFASLTFLAIFLIVNLISGITAERATERIQSIVASAGLAAAFVLMIVWLLQNEPSALIVALSVAFILACARFAFVLKR